MRKLAYKEYLKITPKQIKIETDIIDQELRNLKAELDKAEKKKATAYFEGDSDLYYDTDEQCKRLKAAIKVKTHKRDQMSDIPVEVYVEAWEKYADDYNKEFDKRWSAYLKNKERLADEYLEIIRFISEGNNEESKVSTDLGDSEDQYHSKIRNTITRLKKPDSNKAQSGYCTITVDGLLVVDSKKLDNGRRDNIAAIESGSFIKDINEPSLYEYIHSKVNSTNN